MIEAPIMHAAWELVCAWVPASEGGVWLTDTTQGSHNPPARVIVEGGGLHLLMRLSAAVGK